MQQFVFINIREACVIKRLWKELTLSTTTTGIIEMLSSILSQKKTENQHCLLNVWSTLRFFARQGCIIRNHDESDRNIYQLLKLHHVDNFKVGHYNYGMMFFATVIGSAEPGSRRRQNIILFIARWKVTITGVEVTISERYREI